MHDESADSDFLRFGERITQHRVTFVGLIAIRKQE
jgi:hypothetical protein